MWRRIETRLQRANGRRSIRTRPERSREGFLGKCGAVEIMPETRRYRRLRVHDDDHQHRLDALWAEVQSRLRASVPESTFRLWLEPLRVVGSRGRTLHLGAPEGIRAWVERRYSSLIRDGLAGAGSDFEEISFGPVDGLEDGGEDAGLNPHHSFDRFVIGEGNRLAHAAALAVAEAPSEAYNPLFLHGPPGLGKTHLLVAIANYLRAHAAELEVRYTTAERFTNEFVAALRSSGAERFKERHRDLDVLLVDDVQFLEGKHATEEEFFHTFNALYEGGSQLVLSADRLPSELSTLAERLRDRFEWGLTVPVDHPDLATRLTVLRRLAREAGLESASREALAELAGRIDTNVRRLRGALTKVIAHSSITDEPLSPELVAEVVPSTRRAGAVDPVEEIQAVVASAFGVSTADLLGPSRAAGPVRARHVAILLTREGTELSLPEIGQRFGGRDHSTVLNSVRRAEAAIGQDPELETRVNSLRETIHNPSGRRR
jgi:chromosomal replication initiator protein